MARLTATLSDFYGPTATAAAGSSTMGAALPAGPAVATNTNLSSGIGGAGGSVPVTSVLAGWQGSILARPLTWLFGLVLVLVAWKLIEEHRGGKEAFSKVKVDGTNLIKIGLMATIFLIIARYFFARYSVPGISDLIVGGT